jgi:WD40 repeat protein
VTQPNAYVGPRSVPPERRLYGRDRELLALTNRLLSERLILLYSPSGAGKTSLLMAANGLCARMAHEGFFPLPSVRLAHAAAVAAGRRVNRYLLGTLLSLRGAPPDSPNQGPASADALATELAAAGPELPSDYLHRAIAALTPPGRQPLLVFDQFEEFLTLDPTDDDAKRAYLRQVGHALKDSDRWAVFALREDYVAGLDPYLPLLPTRLAATFRLDFLGRGAAREAAQGPPAEDAFRVEFEPEAVSKLVDELARVKIMNPVTGQPETKDGLYVEPLHLQLICHRLWAQKVPRPGDTIATEDLDRLTDQHAADLRGVDAALAAYYAETVTDVARRFASAGVTERAIRSWFDQAAISPRGLRLPVLLGTEEKFGLTPAVLKALADGWLIRADHRHGGVYYELAHDRLVEPVRRSNAAWRGKLTAFQQAADLWKERDKNPDLLASGKILHEGERLEKEYPGELSRSDRGFLQASRKARRQWRNRVAAVTVGVTAVLLLLAWVVWLQQSQVALQRQQLADERKQVADSKVQLGLQKYLDAERKVADDPQGSAKDALEAIKLFQESDPSQRPKELIEELLPKALANRGMRILGIRAERVEVPVAELLLDPTGKWLFSRGIEGSVAVWSDPCGPDPRMIHTIPTVRAMALTPDGKYLLVGHTNGQVCRWRGFDPPDFEVLHDSTEVRQDSTRVPVTSLAVSRRPNMPLLAVGYGDGRVNLFYWDAPKLIQTWSVTKNPISNLAFTPYPIRLLTDSQDGNIKSWDVSKLPGGTEKPRQVIQTGPSVNRIAISPAADVFAVGTTYGQVQFYQMEPYGKEVGAFVAVEGYQSAIGGWKGPVTTLTFGPGSGARFLALATTAEQSAGVFGFARRSTGWVPQFAGNLELSGGNAYVTAAAFSPDGAHILAGASDGGAYIWQVANLRLPQYELQASPSAVSAVGFGPAPWVFTGTMHGRIRRWNLNRQDRVEDVQKELPADDLDKLHEWASQKLAK